MAAVHFRSLMIASAGAALLAACGQQQERAAQVEEPGVSAEVRTTLPEHQVSDQQLENVAAGAAAAAATPQAGAAVVVTPGETTDAAGGAPAANSASAPASTTAPY